MVRTGARSCVVIALALLLGTSAPAQRVQVRATVDPRVELLSIIFRLAGNPEYNQGRIDAYTRAVEERFGKGREHPAVRRARGLRRGRGVSFDAPMSLAVHLKDARSLKLALPLDPWPEGLDERWPRDELQEFLNEAAAFAKEYDFPRFTREQKTLYGIATARMQAVLKEARLEWFAGFFGARPRAEFHLALGMLNGGACYGPRMLPRSGKERLWCILGAWSPDDEGLPRFDKGMLSTVAHEFTHSYVNHLVDANAKKLEPSGTKLYPMVAEAMKRQAYGNWQTMLKESLVRACVVRYVAAHEGASAARREIDTQQARKFVWTRDLAKLLQEYEQERRRYPRLEKFMPRVVAFFDDWAAGAEEWFAKDAAGRPKVVSMVPANGSIDVDPTLSAIVITFDRPMRDRSWAFVGGGPRYPKTTGPPSYDAAKRVITLPVKLEPEHDYEFWLNRGKYSSFRSAEGTPLESVRVTFSTGKAR